jgi:hypothetical protein
MLAINCFAHLLIDMPQLLDRATLLMIISAFIVALLCVLPESRGIFPFWVIAAGANVADTLFHELGHTITAWLFGHPAIPMIFTLFGANQASGYSLYFQRSWFLQAGAFAALGIGCYWVKGNMPFLFIPAIVLTLIIIAVAFSGYDMLAISYMGHGGTIAMGGFFLFRAWIYLDSRNQFERWLNAFLGFFQIIYNMHFSYQLAFDWAAREVYSDHVDFGISHNDFWQMAMEVPNWSVKGIAIFTIGYCVMAIIGSFLLAVCLQDKFRDNP